MSTCSFTSTKYDAAVTTIVASITVDAVAPNNQDQLTTTINGPTHTGAAPIITAAAKLAYVGGAAAAAMML